MSFNVRLTIILGVALILQKEKWDVGKKYASVRPKRGSDQNQVLGLRNPHYVATKGKEEDECD